MSRFLQTLMDGVSVGSLYALIALGYTMVYGVLRFINFAHGDIFMLGSWLSYWVCHRLGWKGEAPPTASMLEAIGRVAFRMTVVLGAVMAMCGFLGLIIERFAYKPLRNAPRLNVLITAIGVSLLIQNVGQLKPVFGTENQRMPQVIPARLTLATIEPADDEIAIRVLPVEVSALAVAQPPKKPEWWKVVLPISPRAIRLIDPVNVLLIDVMIVLCSLMLMVVLDVLVYRSRMGLAMRAVSFDTRTASLMGVNINRTVSITFVTGSMLAAAAGFLYASKYPNLNQPAFQTWCLLGLKAFVAAVVGGIGNVRGAMLGGLLIGLLEQFGAAYVSDSYKEVYVFSLLIVFLLVRPTGLLGRPEMEKV